MIQNEIIGKHYFTLGTFSDSVTNGTQSLIGRRSIRNQ